MEVIIKASAVAMIAALAALTVKKYNPETAYITGVAAAVIIATASASMIFAIKDYLGQIIQTSGISPAILVPPIKCTAIAVTVKIVSSLSKDSGQAGVASAVEYLGAAAAIYTVLPMLKSIMNTLGELI